MIEHLARPTDVNVAAETVGSPNWSTTSPPATLPPRSRPRKRLTREERAEDARASIFAAAAKVVGQYGYADASVTKITEAAGIAQGTFYLYFHSRQALFDELLPNVGTEMFQFIRDRVTGATDVLDVEERGIRAFFDFLEVNPGFFRILNEAEVAAPIAHERHFGQTARHFVESLRRGIAAGHIREFDEEELETVVYVFMAARSYLYLRYVKGKAPGAKVPEKAIAAYLRLIRNGLK